MRVAVATIMQESNTFSPVSTYWRDFDPVFGAAVLDRHRGKLTETGGFLDVLEREKVEAVPVCAAWAITANRLVRADFHRLAARFEKELRAAGPVDGLLLAMHGAQTAETEDDVEGHILGRARRVLGPDKPIVVSLDLHANVTRAMVERATAIVGYHTYPHIDMIETGQKAARLLVATLRGQIQPTMALAKLPLIVNAENSQSTSGPFSKLIRRAQKWERSGKALAASVFPVQPWMDIDEMGSAVVVVTNNDGSEARQRADRLARQFWESRDEFVPQLVSVEEALRRSALIDGGPVVLAESSDSTGSGSPGDSTGVLGPLLDAELTGPAAIFLVDPKAVARAHALGVGKRFRAAIGGCFDRENSQPVRVDGVVQMLSDGRWTPRARGYNPGIETSMGRAAVVVHGQVKILIAERSAMTVDPELFRSHGIEPRYMKIVVVKSPNGFRAAYEPIARAIFVVDTPGVSTARLERLTWKRIPRPIVPLDTAEWSPGQ